MHARAFPWRIAPASMANTEAAALSGVVPANALTRPLTADRPAPLQSQADSTEQDKQWRIQSGGNADQSPA